MEINLENVLCIFLSELFTAVTEWTALENEKLLFQLLIFYFSRIKSLGISLTSERFTLFSAIIANNIRRCQLHQDHLVVKQSYLLVTGL